METVIFKVTETVLPVCSYKDTIYVYVVIKACYVVTAQHILFQGIHEFVLKAERHCLSHLCGSHLKKMVQVELEIVVRGDCLVSIFLKDSGK